MKKMHLLLAVIALPACATAPPHAELARQVGDTERAFAATMAVRDHAAFTSFLSEETVFFSPKGPLRGKAEVSAAWRGFYEGPKPPFSWEPKDVEVLPSGELALTSGPVHDPRGKRIGTFMSIWRQEAPGTWRIVFDKGCDACEACPKK